jgi:hypothetical protein
MIANKHGCLCGNEVLDISAGAIGDVNERFPEGQMIDNGISDKYLVLT